LVYYAGFVSAPKIKQQTAKRKALRVEAFNPSGSAKWTFLWEFDKDLLIATQKLIDELNIINAPVVLRIVANTDKIITDS
jgi:hypothetical protein